MVYYLLIVDGGGGGGVGDCGASVAVIIFIFGLWVLKCIRL